MSKRFRRFRHLGGREALEALASPARQELLMAFGRDGASVRQLAVRLGRSRSALHYHAGILERARLIERVGVRGKGRDREVIYAPTADALALNARKGTRSEIDVTRRAAEALLRLTGRELKQSLGNIRATGVVVPGAPMVARAKARLTARQLDRVGTLAEELLALFAASGDDDEAPLYAITIVVTPSRDVNAPDPSTTQRRVR